MADVKQLSKSGNVRVSIPMSVASDIGKFKESVKGILDRLGCPACCSSFDIFFEMQRDLRFDGDLDRPIAAMALKKPVGSATAVTASVSPKLAGNIKDVFAVLDRIVDLSAHPACTSGDDLFLRIEQNFLIDRAGQIDEQALVVGR